MNYAVDGMFSDTPTHEFFHVLGAYHLYNDTNSIRSYSGARKIKQSDIKDVFEAYQKVLSH